MTMRRAFAPLASGLIAIALAACSDTDSTGAGLASGARGEGGGPVVATVEGLTIPTSVVEQSAHARNVSAKMALDSLIDDALATNEAFRRKLDRRRDVERSIDAALARQVARHLRQEALARGPLDDKELAELTARHWKEVDLPERATVVHAVVRKPGDGSAPLSADAAERARLAAEALRAAVLGESTPEGFEAKAKAFQAPGFELRVERLPTMAADGRITELGTDAEMDKTFAEAALRVAPGATSPVVETRFGWHVIHGIDHLAAEVASPERRREMFNEEVLATRARNAYVQLVEAAKKKHPPQIETYAESALASLEVPEKVALP